MPSKKYKAIVSSDWNQCLAPCGPFDPLTYNYPDLNSELERIFKAYTGNQITLGSANARISRILPSPLTIDQMDAYLEAAFVAYQGVPELIDWCNGNDILFMINTTGVMAYFQRIFVKHLLPRVPVVSANPMLRYPHSADDPPQMIVLEEIEDKGKNTARALAFSGIPEGKIVIIGDSGGDGPHFEWASKHGAYLIGSMAKPSLLQYCGKKGIAIDLLFGPTVGKGEERILTKEMEVDFMALKPVIERVCE